MSVVTSDGRVVLSVPVLQMLRKKHGFSQEKLAERCQEKGLRVSLSSIKRAETGSKVLYRIASELAGFYEVPVETLHESITETPLVPVGSTTQTLFPCLLVAIELKDPESHGIPLRTLLQSAGTSSGIDSHEQYARILFNTSQQDIDVFKRVQWLCANIQKSMDGQVRLFILSIHEAQSFLPDTKQVLSAQNALACLHDPDWVRCREILQTLAWGDMLACPWSAVSNVFIPMKPFSPDNDKTKDWWLVSAGGEETCFVGRHAQLAQLTAALDKTLLEHVGQTVCISGMAGVGKTSLLKKLEEHAIQRNHPLPVCFILDFGTAGSRSPTELVFRHLLELAEDATDTTIRTVIANAGISPRSQLFSLWLAGVTLHAVEQRLLNSVDPAIRHGAIQVASREIVHYYTQSRLCLLAIEDMHWADGLMREVLQGLVEATRTEPLFLVTTTRKEGYFSAWPEWLLDAQWVNLDGLNEVEAAELAATLCPDDPDNREQCLRLAKGHPLFLRQLLFTSSLHHASTSASLEQILVLQLFQLPPVDQLAVKVAAVFGQWFSLPQLKAVLGMKDYQPDHLEQKGFIRQTAHRYAFQHDLIRQAVYTQLSRQECQELNLRCAEWYRDKDTLQYALHLKRAGHPDAFSSLMMAARYCQDMLQFEQALQLAEDALTLVLAADRGQVLNFKGKCLLALGKTEKSLHNLTAAACHETRSALASQYWLDCARPYSLTERPEQALSALQKAEACARADSGQVMPHLLSGIYHMHGNLLFPSGDLSGCRQAHQQALDYARQAACKRSEALALSGLGDCAYAEGLMKTGYQTFRQCLNLCEDAGFLDIESENRFMLGTVRIYQLETDQALLDAQLSAMLAVQTGNKRAEIVSRLTAGWVLLDQHELAQAEREIKMGLEIAHQTGASRFIAFLSESLARLYGLQGNFAQAMATIDQALTLVKQFGFEHFIGSWLCATQALLSQDTRVVEQALKQGEQWLDEGCVGHNYLRFYQQGLRVAWGLGQAERVERYRQALAQFVTQEPNPWADLYLEQGAVFKQLLDNTLSISALQNFNSKARRAGLLQACITLEGI